MADPTKRTFRRPGVRGFPGRGPKPPAPKGPQPASPAPASDEPLLLEPGAAGASAQSDRNKAAPLATPPSAAESGGKEPAPPSSTGAPPARRVESPQPAANGRRAIKRPARAPVVKPALFSTTQKVLAGVALVLIAAALFGYNPLLRYWHTRTLDQAPDLAARKAAAEALYEHWGADALDIFAARLDKPDPLAREAAAYGMELVGARTLAYPEVIGQFKEALPKADAAGKLILIRTLSNIAKAITTPRENEVKGPTPEQAVIRAQAVGTAAEALIPCAQEAEQNMEVRLAAVDALCGLRAKGVCKELLKLAGTESGELRNKARAGILTTALPDAAPELLAAMTGPDKELAAVAKEAFVRIRDETPARQLVQVYLHSLDDSPLMNDVRREVIAALGKRANDDQARLGITTALRDLQPEIRILALKAVPCTGLSGSITQLEALAKDSDENVRIASAETLAKLQDADSKTVLLKAFKNDLQGKTLDAYITALGKRSSGKILAEIAIVMPLLESPQSPAAEKSVLEALVQLTRNNIREREAQRRAWDAPRWKAWWSKIAEREKMKDAAVAEIEKIKEQGNKQDRSTYTQLKDALDKQLDVLEACKEKCKPDDLEDVPAFDALLKNYTVVKDFLIKGASFNLRN